MNRPIPIGAAILDYSKLCKYDFHYNVIKPKYGDRLKVVYTDTDSLIFLIQTDDLYADMMEYSDYFDFCENINNHQIFKGMTPEQIKDIKDKNCAVIGKFKDEQKGELIKEVIALKPKMYSVNEYEGKSKLRAKGIPQSAQKKIKHDNFKKCLYSTDQADQLQKVKFHCFEVKKHQIKTVQKEKISLNALDDKRYYIDAFTSRAHGHYLNESTQIC